MKIAVCIKQVPDTETRIKINPEQTGIDETGIKWIVNPYDEFAVEEAIKLKESKADGSTVTVISLGPKKRCVDALRTALAMGADDAIVVDSDSALDAFATAKALAKALQQEGPYDLIFTGKLAIDDNASAVSQMVAEFLKIPHATVVSKFSESADSVQVEREVEGGAREVINMQGPSVIGANKGLNMPRYASLPGIMKAKKKPLKEISLAKLGVSDSDIKVRFKNFALPPEKPPVKMIDGEPGEQAKKLVQLLREEAKVL